MLLFLLMGMKPAPQAPFLPPFDPFELPPKPERVPTPGDCPEAVPVTPGSAVTCHGVLVPNFDVHTWRLDKIDARAWEDAARACERYRTVDHGLCNGRVAVLELETVELKQDVRRGGVRAQVAFPAGIFLGAATTILIAFALEEIKAP
jgi:hypothetical protein